MTRDDAIREACRIVALAYHSIGDYRLPSDGFCDDCPFIHAGFANSGGALDYVRLAVVEKLRRDGYTIADGFDPLTGREIVGGDSHVRFEI